MNCRIIFLVMALSLFGSMSFGGSMLVMDKNVKSYLNARNQGELNTMNRKAATFFKKRVSHIVSIDEKSHETYGELKKFFSKSYNVYEMKDKALRIKKDNIKFNLMELDTHREEGARRILENVVPTEYTDKFMLLSVDVERSFSVSQGDRVDGYMLNFCRLFNGRVVRSPNDFLIIRTDAEGLLKDARIALRDLKETEEVVDVDGDFEENVATLDSLLDEDVNAEKIEKVEVNSVAESYCEVLVGATKKLFPCLSYASEITLSNNEKIGYIIDAPHSRSSWRKYNHENKDTVRFNRRGN